MFARIFMFVLFRLYMYDMDNVYVCIVLTKWSNKNKFFFFCIRLHGTNVTLLYTPPRNQCHTYLFASTAPISHVSVRIHSINVILLYMPPRLQCNTSLYASTASMSYFSVCLHGINIILLCMPPRHQLHTSLYAYTASMSYFSVCLHGTNVILLNSSTASM